MPYVELARNITALGVVSQDSDINKLFMRRVDREEFAKFIELARIENGIVEIKCLGYLGVSFSANSITAIAKEADSVIEKAPKSVKVGVVMVSALGLLWFSCTERGRKQAKFLSKKVSPSLIAGVKLVGGGIAWKEGSENKAQKIRKKLEQNFD